MANDNITVAGHIFWDLSAACCGGVHGSIGYDKFVRYVFLRAPLQIIAQ